MSKFAFAPFGMAVAALLAACASEQPPTSVAQAQEAINAAQMQGAYTYAPQDLQAATQRLNDAQKAVENGRTDEAARMGQEAKADAELAMAKTRAAMAGGPPPPAAAPLPPVVAIPPSAPTVVP